MTELERIKMLAEINKLKNKEPEKETIVKETKVIETKYDDTKLKQLEKLIADIISNNTYIVELLKDKGKDRTIIKTKEIVKVIENKENKDILTEEDIVDIINKSLKDLDNESIIDIIKNSGIIPKRHGGGISRINDAKDVDTTGIQNNSILKYNNTTSKWEISTDSSGVSWGGITGTLANQTDLQTALDGKVDDSQVLTDVPVGAVFTDTIYDDTDIQNALDLKADLVNGQVPESQLPALASSFADLDGSPYDNTSLGNELNDKQDTLVSGSNIKTINGNSIVGSGDLITLAQTLDASDWEKAKILPLNAYAFLKSTSNYADRSEMPSNYRIKGNFTVFKRYNAGISSYSSGFVKLTNPTGDQILIYNSGYTFTIKLYVAGVNTYTYTETSSVNFPSLSKIDLAVEVDFDLGEIRLSYSGYSRTHSVPLLVDLKDSVFTYNKAYINAYYGQVKCWYMFAGLYNYDSITLLFGSTNENALPKGYFKNSSVGKQLITTQPTSIKALGATRTFVGGEVNVVATSVVAKDYMYFGGWSVDSSLAHYNKAASFYMTHSIDVNVGSITFYASGGCPYRYTFRAIEKDTGQVIEKRNLYSSSLPLVTLPVGRWTIYNQFSQGPAYGSLTYFLTMGNNEVNTDITIYQDFELYSSSVVLSGLPRMADYDNLYCPFSDTVLSGSWSLSPVY